jgi:acyl-CoA thioester hydrolase
VTVAEARATLPRMAREDFRLSHALRVRWAEVDPQGIVFNANYLMYFDVAAAEYWRELGFVYPDGFTRHGIDTFAVKATLEYHASARYDDVLDMLVRVSRLGRTSLRLVIEIHRGPTHLVSGELIYVVAELETRKPTPIPDTLRSAILAYERVAPEQ